MRSIGHLLRAVSPASKIFSSTLSETAEDAAVLGYQLNTGLGGHMALPAGKVGAFKHHLAAARPLTPIKLLRVVDFRRRGKERGYRRSPLRYDSFPG